jgi:hypothetical protein
LERIEPGSTPATFEKKDKTPALLVPLQQLSEQTDALKVTGYTSAEKGLILMRSSENIPRGLKRLRKKS